MHVVLHSHVCSLVTVRVLHFLHAAILLELSAEGEGVSPGNVEHRQRITDRSTFARVGWGFEKREGWKERGPQKKAEIQELLIR